MFTPKGSFSSFSVDDVAQAKEFYGQTLGLAVADVDAAVDELNAAGGRTKIYDDPDRFPDRVHSANCTFSNPSTRRPTTP